jgi:aryl-alcohol dehydrogenase-like predicted oxidoreductase
VLAQGQDIVPIPGTRHAKYLRENVAATEISLSDDELRRLSDVAPAGAASGARYPDMSSIDR